MKMLSYPSSPLPKTDFLSSSQVETPSSSGESGTKLSRQSLSSAELESCCLLTSMFQSVQMGDSALHISLLVLRRDGGLAPCTLMVQELMRRRFLGRCLNLRITRIMNS